MRSEDRAVKNVCMYDRVCVCVRYVIMQIVRGVSKMIWMGGMGMSCMGQINEEDEYNYNRQNKKESKRRRRCMAVLVLSCQFWIVPEGGGT